MVNTIELLSLLGFLPIIVFSLPTSITHLIADHRRQVLAKRIALVQQDAGIEASPASIVPLDLWGIHDLLMIGHKGPVLRPDANASHAMVESAVHELARMLEDIHPVAECREAIRHEKNYSEKARASWACLSLDRENFTGAYVSDSQVDNEVAMTVPKFTESLGVCKETDLPRSCSYWASLHAMGVRADMLGKGQDFFKAVVHIISGGALYCFGCTMHFRLLNEYFLPPEVQSEGASFF